MHELEIQKFLRTKGKTLNDLYQRYEIQYTLSENEDKVVFNYRLLSPMDAPIVQESRALVLEVDTWNVLSKGPNAFFAIDETHATNVLKQFNWDNAYAMSKLDGALVTLYYYQNQWCVCTRYSTDGEIRIYTVNASPSTFTWRELTEKCVEDMGYSWEEFTSKLDVNIFYTFEITSPENRVVVIYTERKLTLIAAIQKDSLEEIDIYTLDEPQLKVTRTKVKSLNDANKLLKKHNDPLTYEGFILIDNNFNRLKLRNPKFLQMLQFYSPQDELTALREIRMMDLNQGYPTQTNDVPPTPSNGTGEGSGGISQHTLDSGDVPISPFSTHSLINRMLYLSKYVNESYQSILDSNDETKTHPIYTIWPEAIEYREKGMNMSDILDKTSEEEILEALRKFETKSNAN